MNLGSRLLLALIAWLIYWLTPTELVALWASCLALSTTVFALRSLSSTLIAFTLLLTLLLPITLYQVDTPSLFYKVWFSPLVPLAFLYPDLNRSKGTAPNRGKENRHQLFLILSGLSTALGNGAFQVMNGLLSLSQGVSKSHLTRELRNIGPATSLATLWLILGLLIRLSNNTGIDHLSTAISWIWAPLLCLVFIQLSSRQVSFYLKGLAIGLIASAALGLIVTLINPSPSHPLIEPLVSLGSLHQAMQPGQADQFAAGGFFFHRLKFAHLTLLLLPVLFVLNRRLAYFGLAIVLVALGLSQATWGGVSLVCMSIIFVTLRIWLPRSPSIYLMAVLAFVIGLHAFISHQPNRTAEIIAGSPSLTTRQFMAEQAIEVIVEKPWGLGHGGFKHWSLENYPKELNNRQLPRTLPHNLGLSTVVETGILGWTLMMTLLTYLLGLSLKAFEMKMPMGQEVRLLSVIVGSATIALICLGLLHDPLYHKPVAFSWMLVIALGHRLRALYSM